MAAAALIGVATGAGFALRTGLRETAPDAGARASGAVQAANTLPGRFERVLDPTPALSPDALRRWAAAPLGSQFRAVPRAGTASAADATRAPAARLAAAATPASVAPVALPPLPVPRPAEFRTAEARAVAKAPDAAPLAERPAARRRRTAALPAEPADNRSFLEKLFNVPASAASSGPPLAYAALNTGPLERAPARRLAPTPEPAPEAAGGTAIYDISARTVTLPNGERLEAHSGLGDKLDDPGSVHVRMRGATPPGTYDLTEREQLFHGVRAIRLNPVGGSGAIHGRAGLLAHTFMLGPNGDSNGCISFRDYQHFLQAYLRGEVRRLVVVSGRGDGFPNLFGRRNGAPVPATLPARDA